MILFTCSPMRLFTQPKINEWISQQCIFFCRSLPCIHLLDRQSKLGLTHSQENVDFCVSSASEPPCNKIINVYKYIISINSLDLLLFNGNSIKWHNVLQHRKIQYSNLYQCNDDSKIWFKLWLLERIKNEFRASNEWHALELVQR